MRMLNWVRGAAIAALICTILIFIWTASEAEAQNDWSTKATQATHRFALSQRSLQRDMLNARVGILRNYDSINRDLDNSRNCLEELAALSIGGDVRSLVDDALSRAARQEFLVERFKTNNALLQNALSSFTMASGRISSGPHENRLATRILKLTLDTSPETIRMARAAIGELATARSASPETRHLIINASLVLRLLPAIDRDLGELRGLRLDERSDRLRLRVAEEIAGRRNIVAQGEIALIALGIVTIALVILWLVILRMHNRHFRRLAKNEHLNATVASLLIDGRLFEGEERLQNILEQLANRLGADRAWLDMVDTAGEPWSVFWPARSPQPELLAAWTNIARSSVSWSDDVLRPGGEDLRAAKMAAASADHEMADMMVLRGDDASRALIGFSASQKQLDRSSDIIMAMKAAFAAIRQAFQRHVLEEERLALERKLAHARRMEVIGAVATGVAHNFNNILGAIGGFGEIALAHTQPGSIVRRSLTEIQFAVDRAERVVEEILHFARPHPGKKSWADPIHLLSEAVRMFEASGRSAPLEIEITSAPTRIHVNREQIQQVLLNIFNNAAQSRADCSEITVGIRAEQLHATTAFSHSSLTPGQYVVIEVIDRGRGVAAKNLPRLFEPFFTTRTQGTGLGLSTAWDVVIEHGGTIDVASRLTLGSAFSVWLPVPREAGSQFPAVMSGSQRAAAQTQIPAFSESDAPAVMAMAGDGGSLSESRPLCRKHIRRLFRSG